MALTTLASTTTTELRTQTIQTMPVNRHIMVDVLNGGVKLAKHLNLLDDTGYITSL
jgi:hypothetical protein